MATRKEQKEQRYKEILYAGLDLFVSKGYAATKISDIADKVNMSVGLLFHYFESKEKLYETLVQMGLEGTTYPTELKCKHAIDFFSEFTKQLFQYMEEQPYTAKMFVLMADALRSEATPPHIKKMALKVSTIEKFVTIVEWGQKEGSIREGEPLTISNTFWCCIQGIAEQYAARPELGLPEAEWIVDVVRRR